jgi:hypothetical protein
MGTEAEDDGPTLFFIFNNFGKNTNSTFFEKF